MQYSFFVGFISLSLFVVSLFIIITIIRLYFNYKAILISNHRFYLFGFSPDSPPHPSMGEEGRRYEESVVWHLAAARVMTHEHQVLLLLSAILGFK